MHRIAMQDNAGKILVIIKQDGLMELFVLAKCLKYERYSYCVLCTRPECESRFCRFSRLYERKAHEQLSGTTAFTNIIEAYKLLLNKVAKAYTRVSALHHSATNFWNVTYRRDNCTYIYSGKKCIFSVFRILP